MVGFKCGKYKTDGNLSFLQIFVDQPQCLMFETISCYNSDFPTDGFNSDYSIDMELLVILVNAVYLKNPFPHSFTPKWQHFLCCCWIQILTVIIALLFGIVTIQYATIQGTLPEAKCLLTDLRLLCTPHFDPHTKMPALSKTPVTHVQEQQHI